MLPLIEQVSFTIKGQDNVLTLCFCVHWQMYACAARRPRAALPALLASLWEYDKYDGALPHAPPKGLRPFGIPTMASLQLVLLAALGRHCLRF